MAYHSAMTGLCADHVELFAARSRWPFLFAELPALLPRAEPWRARSQSLVSSIELRVCPRECDASLREQIRPLVCWATFLLACPFWLALRFLARAYFFPPFIKNRCVGVWRRWRSVEADQNANKGMKNESCFAVSI